MISSEKIGSLITPKQASKITLREDGKKSGKYREATEEEVKEVIQKAQDDLDAFPIKRYIEELRAHSLKKEVPEAVLKEAAYRLRESFKETIIDQFQKWVEAGCLIWEEDTND